MQFENYDNVTTEEKHDRAWKVRRVTECLIDKLKHLMDIWGEYIVVDEGMGKCTTKRCGIIRVMPNKPIDKGFKFFMLVDYETGLLIDFILDNGYYSREAFSNKPWGATGEVVLDLVNELANAGRVVVTDNHRRKECKHCKRSVTIHRCAACKVPICQKGECLDRHLCEK